MSWLYTHWTYGIILLISLLALAVVDWRWRLVFYARRAVGNHRRAAALTLVVMVGAFLLWDVCGLALGVFATNPAYTSGINLLTPNMPVEEVLFLLLLNYFVLLVVVGVGRLKPGLKPLGRSARKKAA